jgi:exonuclease VII large subunit
MDAQQADNSAPNDENVLNAPVQTEAPANNQGLLSQEQVNAIVGREKAAAEAKAAARTRQQVEQEYQQKIAQMSQAQEQQNTAVPREVNADAVYQEVMERFNQEMQKQQLENQMTTVANNYQAKMQDAANRYEDFSSVTQHLDPTKFPQIVYLVSGMQNGGDVMYDLAKNPSKLATIHTLAQTDPELARAELLKLGASIATNQQAQAAEQPVSAPLDTIQPSNLSGSNGKLSIRDLRKQPWLRG